MSDLKRQLGELGKDLMSRQVNLIIAPGGMSAESMPDDPLLAMRDVYLWYHDRLSAPDPIEAARIDRMQPEALADGFTRLARDLVPHAQDAQRALEAQHKP